MLIESDDVVALFDLQIAVCCHERKSGTMCFDCQSHQKAIDLIKKYANTEQIRQAILRRETKKGRAWGFPPFGACPVGAKPGG